ncbi:MAG: O-antigen ligase family protein [Clostridia bacterium]|nr:O-antigen ligase family protein [Clostridia bacterium]
MKKNGKLILPKGRNIICISIYVFSYAIVQFYAVDKGMNILAFFKNLTIILFIILYLQFDDNQNRRLKMIPYSASVSVLLSLFLVLFEHSGVWMNGRLQGIFYYANSYGLFLLLGVFVLANEEKITWKNVVMFLILFVGIVLTNSRAIILLTVLALVVSIFTNKNNFKGILAITICFLALFIGVYLLSNMEKRVDSNMLGSSEFITRLLYYKDALSMIKDNPFGYGYEGWYYKQVEVQTGVYDTKYVHNSILQVALDVGIIPMIVLFVMLVFHFFDKRQTTFTRMMALLILGHSLIDFDLEYLYFIMILILLIDFEKMEMTKNKIQTTCLAVLMCGYFYVFLGDVSFAVGDYFTAIKILPFHTEAIQEILYNVTTKEEQLKYANMSLQYNPNISGAYEALSNDLQSKQEYEEALKYEKKRLSLNKYTVYNYLTFADFLSKGIQYYSANEESDKLQEFLKEVVGIEERINDILAKTNPLCYQTIHTPNLELPEQIQEFIEEAKLQLNAMST